MHVAKLVLVKTWVIMFLDCYNMSLQDLLCVITGACTCNYRSALM